jgi:enamine deaminase RidA (YjgF/YER057c/UK114 family)
VHSICFGWHEIPMLEQVKLAPASLRLQLTQPSVQARQSRSASGRLVFTSGCVGLACSFEAGGSHSAAEMQNMLANASAQ